MLKEWRFNFGLNKIKCMVVGKNKFSEISEWHLNGLVIENVDSLDVLGAKFFCYHGLSHVG